MRMIGLVWMMVLLLAVPSFADTGFTEGAKEIGQGIREGTKETGKGIREGIEEVGKAIVQMEKVTQSTAANAEETASAAEESEGA